MKRDIVCPYCKRKSHYGSGDNKTPLVVKHRDPIYLGREDIYYEFLCKNIRKFPNLYTFYLDTCDTHFFMIKKKKGQIDMGILENKLWNKLLNDLMHKGDPNEG